MPCSKTIATAEQLEQVVSRMAQEIHSDPQYLENCLALVVLEGARFFADDLLAKLDVPIEVAYTKAASYRGCQSSGRVMMDDNHALTEKIRGRNILLIDDIYDTGLTLSALIQWLKTCEPSSIRTCVLLEKRIKHRQAVRIDYLGMTIEDDFVVGYGLDFDGAYRSLPYIGVLSDRTLEKHNPAYKP